MKYPLPLKINYSDESIEIVFKKSNRLYCYDKKIINEYLINEIFNTNREFSIVYGLPLSGKKVINSFLSTKYGYKLFDFNIITEALKKRMAGEEGNPDEQVVDFNKFLAELKDILSKIPLTQRFLLQNINLHIKEVDQIDKLIEVCGVPKYFFDLCTDNIPLMDRYKIKLESQDPLTEEQKEECLKLFVLPKKIKDKLKAIAVKVLPVNTSMAESTAHLFVNKYLGRNFIVIKHDYDININNVLYLISATHKVLVLNVPFIIHSEFMKNLPFWQKLNSTYSKKNIKPRIITSEEEKIYYDYNPIHFCNKVVRELIDNYIIENMKEIENSANIVILVGYLNNDLLEEQNICFNLPLLEINSLNNLGNILSFIQISRGLIQTVENEEAFELEKPKKIVKEVKKDDLDKIDEENNKDKKEEDKKEEEEKKEVEKNEDGTDKIVYHPELYKWTSTDGIYRNYIQHIVRYTKFPMILNNVVEKSLHELIYKTVTEIIVGNLNIYNDFISFLQSENKEKNIQKNGKPEGKICLFVIK